MAKPPNPAIVSVKAHISSLRLTYPIPRCEPFAAAGWTAMAEVGLLPLLEADRWATYSSEKGMGRRACAHVQIL